MNIQGFLKVQKKNIVSHLHYTFLSLLLLLLSQCSFLALRL